MSQCGGAFAVMSVAQRLLVELRKQTCPTEQTRQGQDMAPHTTTTTATSNATATATATTAAIRSHVCSKVWLKAQTLTSGKHLLRHCLPLTNH